MKPRAAIRFSLLALALAATSTSAGCQDERPKEPAAEAKATPQVTQSAPSAKAKPAPPTYPAPEAFEIAPAAVGQWIRIAIYPKSAPPSQTYIRVVGQEGDALWFEVETNTPTGTTVTDLLMPDAARRRGDKTAVQKARTLGSDGGVKAYEGKKLTEIASVVEQTMEILALPNVKDAQREEAKAPAGVFQGAFVHDVVRTDEGVETKTKSSYHPAVPLIGFVRSEGIERGKPTKRELLEMHTTGAKSKLGPL